MPAAMKGIGTVSMYCSVPVAPAETAEMRAAKSDTEPVTATAHTKRLTVDIVRGQTGTVH